MAQDQVNIKTVSFYEMKPLSAVGLVVEQGDADPGVPHAGLYPLDNDHRTICKPTSNKTEIHLYNIDFIRGCLSPTGSKKSQFDEVLKVSLKGHGASTAPPPFSQ